MKRKKHNQNIRDALKTNGIRQWELSDMMAIHENSLSRLLRYELSPDKAGEILKIIEKMAKASN